VQIVIFLGTGCAISRYRYISLEDAPGVVVQSHGAPALESLRFSSEMPVEYSVDREHYRLRFRVDVDSYLPKMGIAVDAKKGEALSLAQQRWRKTREGRSASCASFYPVENSASELDFAWVTCADDTEAERYISFDVVGAAGRVIGIEDIPFKLKTNGVYVLPDLL
jgi:hypothetical protein